MSAAGRHTYACPIRWSDMDAYGHVNNVQFLTYLEEARIDLLMPLIEQARKEGRDSEGILVASNSITYRRPLVHSNEPVPIDIWITRLGAAMIDLAYEVHDGNPADDDTAGTVSTVGTGRTIYADARSRVVPYDFRIERPRRLRPAEREFLAQYLVGSAPAAH